MGSHRTQNSNRTPKSIRALKKWPTLPDNIGKKRKIKTIDGRILHWRIEDEIILSQTNSDRKIIVFQKMRNLEEDRVEFRLGYYMIGVKPRRKGQWVWGQFCLFIPQEDLVELIRRAKRKNWF